MLTSPNDHPPRIAVFSGPGTTVTSTAPLVTSNKARAAHGLPAGEGQRFDALRPQRIAAPATVYVEQFSAHPMERDAAHLYGPPDGYVDAEHRFHRERTGPDDVPVYEVRLLPEDGLYPLPYFGRQRDGQAWDGDCVGESLADELAGEQNTPGAHLCRQPFFPDGERLVEEIDRLGVSRHGTAGILSALADFDFFRPAPAAGYRSGREEARAEELGVDYFPYRPPHLRRDPTPAALARITNNVAEVLASNAYQGAVWLDASPALEETVYWLGLLVDTGLPIVGVCAPDWGHGIVGNTGDRALVDAVRYIVSGLWSEQPDDVSPMRDNVGPVIVQGGVIYAAREAQKVDSRPGGFDATGGYGGVVGSTGHGGSPVTLTFRTRRSFTARSEVRLSRLPDSVRDGAYVHTDAIPHVEIIKQGRYQADPPGTVEAAIERGRALPSGMTGLVVEGTTPYGTTGHTVEAALRTAQYAGIPCVKVARGDARTLVDRSTVPVGIAGGNLTATKARLLLMACLLRFGAPPAAADPANPTQSERSEVDAYVERCQAVFDTH